MFTEDDLQNKSHGELVALLQDAVQQRDDLAQKYDALNAEYLKLTQMMRDLQRRQFGRSSEKISDDQLDLQLEDVSQAAAAVEGKLEEVSPASDEQQAKRQQHANSQKKASGAKRNRGRLPVHLEREDVYVEPEDGHCSGCAGELHVIGEDVSEQLDYVPARFKVKRIHRPRYGCRQCESTVQQAYAPDRLLTGGIATAGLIAHVLVSKYADHIPLYRQSEMFQRQGIDLDRSTLTTWVGRAAGFLEPLHDAIHAHVLAGERVFADETPLPMLEPGRGKTKTGYIWAYARDDGPFGGDAPPAVSYRFAADRKAEHARDHLTGYRAILQTDAYAGFKKLLEDDDKEGIQLTLCWAHLRRRFYDIHQATGSPIAAEALRRIGELYAIEKELRGKPPDVRWQERQRRSAPIIADLKPWLETQKAALPGKAKLAEAIRYALSRWERFTVFLEDGRIELDTNTVERTIRPIALGRKNSLFAGSDDGGKHWATIATLIQTAKLNGVDPWTYLTDVLERLLDGRTKINAVQDLVPWIYPATMDRATA